MKTATEFLKLVNAARENVQREAYLIKRNFLDQSLETKEAKGSYIQYGYVKIDNEKLESTLQEKLKKYKDDYDLTNGAIDKICEDADKQVEEFLRGLGWSLNQEKHLVPLELKAESANADEN